MDTNKNHNILFTEKKKNILPLFNSDCKRTPHNFFLRYAMLIHTQINRYRNENGIEKKENPFLK